MYQVKWFGHRASGCLAVYFRNETQAKYAGEMYEKENSFVLRFEVNKIS